MRKLAIVALLMLLPTAPAWADWGATHWGMTLTQVLDIVPGARPLERKDDGGDLWKQQPLAAAPSTDEGIALTGDFYFDPDHQALTLVKLIPNSVSDCERYLEILIKRHGKGKREERPFPAMHLTVLGILWTDPKTHERLIYSSVTKDDAEQPNHCHFIQRVPE